MGKLLYEFRLVYCFVLKIYVDMFLSQNTYTNHKIRNNIAFVYRHIYCLLISNFLSVALYKIVLERLCGAFVLNGYCIRCCNTQFIWIRIGIVCRNITWPFCTLLCSKLYTALLFWFQLYDFNYTNKLFLSKLQYNQFATSKSPFGIIWNPRFFFIIRAYIFYYIRIKIHSESRRDTSLILW